MFIDEIRQLAKESKINKYESILIQIQNKIIESAKNGLSSTKYTIDDLYIDEVTRYIEAENFTCKLNKSFKNSSQSILIISW